MIVETKNLTGPALDWAVAFALGASWTAWRFVEYHSDGEMHYSTSWLHGGPIIERERISISPEENGWSANICAPRYGLSLGFGPTPLIAAMRCFVASRLGDEVEIPEELL